MTKIETKIKSDDDADIPFAESVVQGDIRSVQYNEQFLTFQPLGDLRPYCRPDVGKPSGRNARRDIDHPQLQLTGVPSVIWIVDGSCILQGWPERASFSGGTEA